jgi:hypothetical protein
MTLHKRWEEYAQEIFAGLVNRGLIVTAQKTAAVFTVEIKWPGPNGRDHQSFACNGDTLLAALEMADHQAGKILPVKLQDGDDGETLEQK